MKNILLFHFFSILILNLLLAKEVNTHNEKKNIIIEINGIVGTQKRLHINGRVTIENIKNHAKDTVININGIDTIYINAGDYKFQVWASDMLHYMKEEKFKTATVPPKDTLINLSFDVPLNLSLE